jgi:toxin ParE1/3/4
VAPVSAATLSGRARGDLRSAARWIARDNPPAARALRRAVTAAAQRLGDFPLAGVERRDLAAPPVRFLILSGFPYVLVYDAGPRPPVILRVLHSARDLPEVLRDLGG